MPPLTTRDALTAALAEALHGLRFGAVPPEGVDPYAREDAAHLADALLASGALEAVKAEALREAAVRMPAFHDRDVPEWAITSACRWLQERAAALSAQSERAEVER